MVKFVSVVCVGVDFFGLCFVVVSIFVGVCVCVGVEICWVVFLLLTFVLSSHLSSREKK